MNRQNKLETHFYGDKTPKVFNVDNPVQAEGAARGRACRPTPYNPVGVELLTTLCSAPTERRDRELYLLPPSCAAFCGLPGVIHICLLRRRERWRCVPSTVRLAYCLDRCALYERELTHKRKYFFYSFSIFKRISLFIIHYSLFIIHYSLFINYEHLKTRPPQLFP
jgi:hypothetical protein